MKGMILRYVWCRESLRAGECSQLPTRVRGPARVSTHTRVRLRANKLRCWVFARAQGVVSFLRVNKVPAQLQQRIRAWTGFKIAHDRADAQLQEVEMRFIVRHFDGCIHYF